MRLSRRRLPDVGQRRAWSSRRRTVSSVRGEAVLLVLLGDRLAVVGRLVLKQLGAVGARRRARDEREQQRRAGAERLAADVARRGLGGCSGASAAFASARLCANSLASPAISVSICVADLCAGAAVDGDERDPEAERAPRRDPAREAPAQADVGEPIEPQRAHALSPRCPGDSRRRAP